MYSLTKYTKSKLCIKLIFLYTVISRCTANKTKDFLLIRLIILHSIKTRCLKHFCLCYPKECSVLIFVLWSENLHHSMSQEIDVWEMLFCSQVYIKTTRIPSKKHRFIWNRFALLHVRYMSGLFLRPSSDMSMQNSYKGR